MDVLQPRLSRGEGHDRRDTSKFFIRANPGFPGSSPAVREGLFRFFWWLRSFLCGISPSACPRDAVWYFPGTELRGIGSEEGKGACQGTVSEFTQVTILNFAASGNSRSRKRSSAQFFRHQAGGAFQNHDVPGCENGLYTNVALPLRAFSFTELAFLKMLTTVGCF